MGQELVETPVLALQAQRTHGFLDDAYGAEDFMTSVATDSGVTTVTDAAGGVISLAASDGTVADNDEIYRHTISETFKFAVGKPIEFYCRAQYTEANTDDANVYIGLMDAMDANALVDNGAGPKTTASAAGFFKVDGGTNWNVIYSDSTTQVKVELTAANSLDGLAKTAGGSAYQVFEIKVLPLGSRLDVLFFINGVHVYTIADRTFANATEMDAGLGIKNGGANLETLNYDLIYCYQTR